MLKEIVISRVAQFYHDRWIDRLDINETGPSAFALIGMRLPPKRQM
jgi:hypothetical protein